MMSLHLVTRQRNVSPDRDPPGVTYGSGGEAWKEGKVGTYSFSPQHAQCRVLERPSPVRPRYKGNTLPSDASR